MFSSDRGNRHIKHRNNHIILAQQSLVPTAGYLPARNILGNIYNITQKTTS